MFLGLGNTARVSPAHLWEHGVRWQSEWGCCGYQEGEAARGILPPEADTDTESELLKNKLCSFVKTPHLGQSSALGREPEFPVHTLPSRIATPTVDPGCVFVGKVSLKTLATIPSISSYTEPLRPRFSQTIGVRKWANRDRNRAILSRSPPGKMYLFLSHTFLAHITVSLDVVFWSLSLWSPLISQ